MRNDFLKMISIVIIFAFVICVVTLLFSLFSKGLTEEAVKTIILALMALPLVWNCILELRGNKD